MKIHKLSYKKSLRIHSVYQALHHVVQLNLIPSVIWLTGLSGAGKSTIAEGLRKVCQHRKNNVAVLDGDVIRSGLSSDLGFSCADRTENIRRIACTARLLCDQGMTVVVAAVSPLCAQRTLARSIVGTSFNEVFVQASLAVCEHRDVKGLYSRARRSEIPLFTGVSDIYEPPLKPDLTIDTSNCSVSSAVQHILSLLVIH